MDMDSTIPSKKRKLSESTSPLIEEIPGASEPPVKKKKKDKGAEKKTQESQIETPTTDFGELSLGENFSVFNLYNNLKNWLASKNSMQILEKRFD